jgi:phosphate starvation-inducible PhoH-like protein
MTQNARTASSVRPFNKSQEKALELLKRHPIVCLIGPAGCGKTHVAAHFAATAVKRGKANSIVYIRLPVEMGRSRVGFLPGEINEKMAPYAAPIAEIGKKIGISPTSLKVFAPGFIQGMTFDDAILIVDECQVFDEEEFLSIVTRLGVNSKLILCGDPTQDTRHMGQLYSILDKLATLHSVGIQNFDLRDNMRHPVIVEVLNVFRVPVRTIRGQE